MEKLLELLKNTGFTPMVKYIRERGFRGGFINSILIRGSKENINVTSRIVDTRAKLKITVTRYVDENVLWEIERRSRCEVDMNEEHIYISCSNMLDLIIGYLRDVLRMIEEKRNEK